MDVDHHEEEGTAAARVWEAAGGYAPTAGIREAVLGLIHVMENLADPSKLGGGIATAFVATVYGVGAANPLFLTLGNKIKMKIKQETGMRFMLIAGLEGIASGENPFAEYKPLADNTTPERQAKNRRVELLVVMND